jgi:hypothetical protein
VYPTGLGVVPLEVVPHVRTTTAVRDIHPHAALELTIIDVLTAGVPPLGRAIRHEGGCVWGVEP